MTDPRTPLPATRRKLLDELKRGGPQSATLLAETLAITPMAVRQHLYGLEEEGLVTNTATPSGRGRPTKLWALTDDAARIFPDAHQGLAVELLKSVEALFGTEGTDKIIARHGEVQLETYRGRLSGASTLKARLERLAEARSDEGYMAHVERDGADYLFIENHCPVCSAAKTCTQLCANELNVFREALGGKINITREEHILAGARRCLYRVSVLSTA